jgi:DNA-binding response OmpR family regulator
MSTRRILCVHEGPGLQQLTDSLRVEGYEVLPASDSTKALDLLSSQEIDGVVLDYDLSAPGGYSLRGRIQHERPGMPMLLFNSIEELRQTPIEVFRACMGADVESAFELAVSLN